MFRGLVLATCAAIPVGVAPAHALDLYTGGGFDLRWDNTLRYSAGARLNASNALILSYPNSDDGDRNFARGLMMNRFDLYSVLDLTGNNLGAQLSVRAWYDTVYHHRTDNTSPATYNASVPNTQFPPATVKLDGQHIELADSFLYDNLDIGTVPVSLRLGRQTLLWGESLFFDKNGINGAMAPVDYFKQASMPAGYSRDVFLPVNQLSVTAQIQSNIALAAYYQLEWRPDQLPGVGSYFSTSDIQGAGTFRAFLTRGQFLLHAPDRAPPSGGQYGVSLRATIDEFDLGLYALRFHAKYPVLNVQSIPSPQASGYAGTFESTYPSGIDLYGASFSGYLGDTNLAGELSVRRHMPLVSESVSLTIPRPLNENLEYGYAEGDTLHGQISSVTTLAPSLFWSSADISGEVAASDVLDVTRNPAALRNGRTRFAASFRMLFQPHYFQLLPNLDLTPLFSLGYNFTGLSATDYTQNVGAGDFELGIAGTYLSVWKADLTMTSYFGLPYRQPMVGRDFLMMRLEHTF